jgi:hypothetical protein
MTDGDADILGRVRIEMGCEKVERPKPLGFWQTAVSGTLAAHPIGSR